MSETMCLNTSTYITDPQLPSSVNMLRVVIMVLVTNSEKLDQEAFKNINFCILLNGSEKHNERASKWDNMLTVVILLEGIRDAHFMIF